MLSLTWKVDFLKTAEENEGIFRAILEDLRNNRAERTMWWCVPDDLDTTSSIETLYQKYSWANDIFTIFSFTLPDDKTAIIHFQWKLFRWCGGAKLQYTIDENKQVSFDHRISCRMD